MSTWMSAEINVYEGPEHPEAFSFRGIQTDDEKIKKQLTRDLSRLIKKYESKGCHILR